MIDRLLAHRLVRAQRDHDVESRRHRTDLREDTFEKLPPRVKWSGRMSRISSGPSSPEQSGAPLIGVLTMIPEPGRSSTYPSTSKAISASRMDGRETPNRSASSRSAGRRLPGGNPPAAI